jgi:hypothetical protein
MLFSWESSLTTFSTALDGPPDGAGPFVVSEAKAVPRAYVHCRDDLQGVRFAHNHLTSPAPC